MAIGVFFSDFGVGLYETLRDLQRATDPFVLGSYFNGWIEIFLFLGLVGARMAQAPLGIDCALHSVRC